MNGWGGEVHNSENVIREDIRALVELLTSHHADIAQRLDAINGTVKRHSVDIATHTQQIDRLNANCSEIIGDVDDLKEDSVRLRTATKVAVAIVSALGTLAFAAFEIFSRFR